MRENRSQPRKDAPRKGRPGVRFVVLVLVLLVIFFFVERQPVVARHLTVPYTGFVAASAAILLRLMGIDVVQHGVFIDSAEFSIEILKVCNGVEVAAIFAAAVLAFPATLRQKAAGLAVGLPAIYLINLVRIAALFLIGSRHRVAFEDAHYYYAQAFVIVATASVWLLWVSLSTSYGSKGRRPVSA